MKRRITVKNEQILKKGRLKKSGEEYVLILQSPDNIAAVLALQETVYDALLPEEKNFLLLKDRKFFEQHLDEGNPVLGIVHDGKLIAQSIVINPTRTNPKSGMVDMILDALPEHLTVLQGVIVDPAYRGNNLLTIMVDEWLLLAKQQGRKHALAEVTVENKHSWAVFMKEGLRIHSIGHDATDGATLYNLHAPVNPLINSRLKREFNRKSGRNTLAVHQSDVEKQKELIAQGHQGVKYDPANQNISFKKIRKHSRNMGRKI